MATQVSRRRGGRSRRGLVPPRKMQIQADDVGQFDDPTDAPIGKIVAKLPLDDEIPYRLAKKTVIVLISIRKSLEVRVKSPLDREELESEELLVLSAVPSITHVHIHIDDINDNAPIFPAAVQKISIAETSPIGSRTSLLSAFDPDSGLNGTIVEYSLISVDFGEADETFILVREDDQIFLEVRQSLDREIKATYAFNLTASDGGTPSL
ncbi:unnamed protein product [Caenorhabditis auriculariae]|uniref:Cadherin domain-containing protein n=1 Tax=Caenorhabditis auriculariae TaxID=2777116 RepID=A0A8S1GX82_9PELO|nr:unnamed protein product [Caenorhabditis auriculariae]